ncbi:MAG TPA: SDR family oxidoreductase [Scandinavium sp.]|jgi:NAD(P)-dependent dehydrogenase (short-subunit alcohol dehydrogenase family)|uniref:SDR family NAD(P)-dependent oxidoreductase n=1 Tax=Scandinavium sp. TaxID=2830653 RepID=UPI002E2FDEA1|nr:SDR family oxidoreductase [Scandinavium sp.]HEX4502166.1 SDR family oxidoreductase [Scandinavium sp.]
MLIIGGTTAGGVGDALHKEVVKEYYPEITPVVPTIDELDVRDPMSIGQFMELNDRHWDYVMYAAGVNYIYPIQELPEIDLEEIFDVNVMGYIRFMTALSQGQTSGRVCAITGISGRIPMRYTTPYCASKAALVHAIRCLAKELGPDWQITGLAPATMQTGMTAGIDLDIQSERGWSAEELARREYLREPFGRRIFPQEVVDVAMMTFMGPGVLTGSIIDVAGGA